MHLLSILIASLAIAATAMASPGGSLSLEGGRAKIQFSVPKDESRGAFALRSLLEKHGFADDDGFVRTGAALAPLEMYNYLYEDGKYVFTIYLPVAESKAFVSFDDKGFVSFEGEAARKLFELVRLQLPKSGVGGLEQYKWAEHSYCDKTEDGAVVYRCWFEK